MNSLRRMLDVLDLIGPGRPTLSVEDICRLLGYTPPTAYRYVRELTHAGLLVRLPAGYALGPRVIELDLLVRENDPLLETSDELMEQLADRSGLSALLAAFYEDTVITVHQVFGREPQPLRFGRGRRLPLFRGASSRVVLAHLEPRRLKRAFGAHAAEADVQRIGADWKAFSQALAQVRRQGWCHTRGELAPGRAGVAAPIFDEQGRVLGSLTLVGGDRLVRAAAVPALAGQVVAAAAEITQRIGAGAPLREKARAAAARRPGRVTGTPRRGALV